MWTIPAVQTRTLQDPAELLDIAWSCTETFESQPWFRGHADERWKLQPEICRPEILRGRERGPIENRLAWEFRRQAETRLPESPPRTWSDWLALMQHHGLPTRLLDWSTSILIAAFFAVQEPDRLHRDGVIWALDPLRLNEIELGTRVLATADDPIGRLACRLPFVEHPLAELDREPRGLLGRLERAVVAMEPRESFGRMLLQQSRFTVHGRSEGLDETPGEAPYLCRFVIPAASKAYFAQTLGLLGIRPSTVFPDLDHLAEELRDLSLLERHRPARWKNPA
jgi:FRG domain-containing protein